MQEQFLQLGLGGAGFLTLFLVIKMLMRFIKTQSEDHKEVMLELSRNIQINNRVGEKTVEAMEAIAESVQSHNDFVKTYIHLRPAGGGDDEPNP